MAAVGVVLGLWCAVVVLSLRCDADDTDPRREWRARFYDYRGTQWGHPVKSDDRGPV